MIPYECTARVICDDVFFFLFISICGITRPYCIPPPRLPTKPNHQPPNTESQASDKQKKKNVSPYISRRSDWVGAASLTAASGTSANQYKIRVTNLRPDDTDEDPFIYMLKVQCTSCRETHNKMVGVNRVVRHQFGNRLVV